MEENYYDRMFQSDDEDEHSKSVDKNPKDKKATITTIGILTLVGFICVLIDNYMEKGD